MEKNKTGKDGSVVGWVSWDAASGRMARQRFEEGKGGNLGNLEGTVP